VRSITRGLSVGSPAMGAEAGDEIEQKDCLSLSPSRDFARDGRGVPAPKRRGPSKPPDLQGAGSTRGRRRTREEVEVGFEDGAEAWGRMLRVLEALGFRTVATVRKIRRPFKLVRGGCPPSRVVLRPRRGAWHIRRSRGNLASSEDLADAPGQGAGAGRRGAPGLAQVEPRSYLRHASLRTTGRSTGKPGWRGT